MELPNLLFVLQLLLCFVATSLQSPLQGHITKPHVGGKAVLRVGEGSVDQNHLYAVIPSKTSATQHVTTAAPAFHPGHLHRRQQSPSSSTTSWPFTLLGRRGLPRATPVPSNSTVPVKDDIKCNISGYPSTIYTQRVLESTSAADILSCQLQCMYRSQCQSYGFTTVATAAGNCVFYAATFDPRNNFVLKDSGSTWVFSDKYPTDGSNYCYGDHQL